MLFVAVWSLACVAGPRGVRAVWGVTLWEPRLARTKKNKKKYAIRDSNPENLLGRQKCYPYTNGVFPTSFCDYGNVS